jgi:hypothetical protein
MLLTPEIEVPGQDLRIPRGKASSSPKTTGNTVSLKGLKTRRRQLKKRTRCKENVKKQNCA